MTGSYRVLRGGSYEDNALNCSSASRNYDYPYYNYYFGFRVACWLLVP